MKKVMAVIITVAIALSFGTLSVFASEGNTLDDVLNSSSQTSSEGSSSESSSSSEATASSKVERENKDKSFFKGLSEAADLSAEAEGVKKATSGIQKVVSFVVQLIAYATIILLSLRIALDLMFIGLPFSRKFLSNGYMGNAQAANGAGGQPGAGGFGGNGFGGGGFGGGGFGGGGFGGGGFGGGYNRFGGGGFGGNGFGGGGVQQQGGNDQQMAMGKIQWVSNAALNAVASENSVGPDGKPRGAFRIYWKDMMIVLIAVPLLFTLAISGVLVDLGLLVGDMLTNFIGNIGSMI